MIIPLQKLQSLPSLKTYNRVPVEKKPVHIFLENDDSKLCWYIFEGEYLKDSNDWKLFCLYENKKKPKLKYFLLSQLEQFSQLNNAENGIKYIHYDQKNWLTDLKRMNIPVTIPTNNSIQTPFGVVDNIIDFAPGIQLLSNAHGHGFYLDDEAQRHIKSNRQQANKWYVKDNIATVITAFPQYFCNEEIESAKAAFR